MIRSTSKQHRGFSWKDVKEGVFLDVHEREDVAEKPHKFLKITNYVYRNKAHSLGYYIFGRRPTRNPTPLTE